MHQLHQSAGVGRRAGARIVCTFLPGDGLEKRAGDIGGMAHPLKRVRISQWETQRQGVVQRICAGSANALRYPADRLREHGRLHFVGQRDDREVRPRGHGVVCIGLEAVGASACDPLAARSAADQHGTARVAQIERVRTPLRRSMVILMAASIAIIVGSEWENVVDDFETAAGGAFALVSGMLGLAYVLARVARLDVRDSFTISIEVGLQNGALATMIVVSLLGRPELIVFPGAYALLSFLPVTLWTFALRRRIGVERPREIWS